MPHTSETFSPLANFDTRIESKNVPAHENIVPEDDTMSEKRGFDIPVEFSDV